MRRFIAYTTLAATMLVAVGVSATPVFSQINPGREFTPGHEISFKINANEGEVLPDNAVIKVADEMRSRLDNFNLDDYSVKIENNDNSAQYVTVSMSCEEDLFNYICKYLTFSGGNFSLSTGGVDETSFIENVIDLDKVYLNQFNDLVPVIVMPLTEEGTTKLETLINSISESSGDVTKAAPLRNAKEVSAEDTDGDGVDDNQPDIYLWGNYESGDNIESAQKDPLIASKIIASFTSKDIWYTEAEGSTAEKEHTEIKLICGTMDRESMTYDFGKLKDANTSATYYLNMLKASKYDYEITCPTLNITSQGLNYFTNSREVPAAAEPLLSYTNDVNLTGSITLITTLVAIVVASVLLAVYFRLLSIGIIATTVSTVYLSFLVIIGMGALFNIPALVGGLIIGAGTLAAEIFYISKFQEEVYKGRSLKKANQEASKKSNMFTLDIAIVTAFAGLMAYLLGGVALKPLGVILFFGSLIALAMNLIMFKILMSLLTNASALQTRYDAFNIREDKVPNLLVEQKETYVAPFEDVNYTAPKKLSSIILGALTFVSLFGILFFGIKDGSPLNVEKATKDTTVVYTTLNSTNTIVNSEETFKNYVLKDIELDGEEVLFESVEMKEVQIYDADTMQTESSLYFTVKIDENYDLDRLNTLQEKITDNIDNNLAIDNKKYEVNVLNSSELVYTPNQGLVALATGISILGAALYFMFRFRPSRGLSVAASTLAAATVGYGLISLLHFGTTAITSLSMPLIAFTSLISSLIYLVNERALVKDSREEMTQEVRNEIMLKALGKSALPTFIFLCAALFFTVLYFGFGLPATTWLFASALIGDLVGAATLFILVGPFATIIEKLFSKIKLPKIKLFEKKENNNQQVKKNSSEPEETTFIGIND